MKYFANTKLINYFIHNRLTNIEDIFICYNNYLSNWMIISKHLDRDNNLHGYIIAEHDNNITFRILTFGFSLRMIGYAHESHKKFATKHDLEFALKITGKVKHAIAKEELKYKHMTAIQLSQKMIWFEK